MKKSIAKILSFIALCCSIMSCSQKSDPYFDLNSQLPTVIPFALDKAGNKAVIDFWVLPDRRNSERGSYMLGLRFEEQEGSGDIGDIIDNAKVPLKVKFFKIKNNAEIPLGFIGALVSPKNSRIEEVGVDKKEEAVYPFRYMSSNLGSMPIEVNMIAAFHLKEYGRYRVYIETMHDNNIFYGKRFDLFVSDNNAGK